MFVLSLSLSLSSLPVFGGGRVLGSVSLSGKGRLTSGVVFGADCRADDKTASEYNLEGGATLHLVLALRGGGTGSL